MTHFVRGLLLSGAFFVTSCDGNHSANPSTDSRTTSDPWVLQRATMSGACHVKPQPAVPNLGALLATKNGRKAICEEALARRTTDATESTKCFEYTVGAKQQCKEEGVTLP
jgi:hypothetical protein